MLISTKRCGLRSRSQKPKPEPLILTLETKYPGNYKEPLLAILWSLHTSFKGDRMTQKEKSEKTWELFFNATYEPTDLQYIRIHSDLICLNVMSKCFSFLAKCGILVMKKREGVNGTKDICGGKNYAQVIILRGKNFWNRHNLTIGSSMLPKYK